MPRRSRRAAARARHAHPQHRPVADIDVVFAHEVEPAVGIDPEDGEARRYGAQGRAVLDRERHDMGGDRQAAGRVDMKRPAVNAARINVLDQARLAGRPVDRIHREIVFAADKDGFTVEFRSRRGAIDRVDKAVIRMDENGAAICRPRIFLGSAKVSLRNTGAGDSVSPENSNMSSLFCRSSET